jgi:hypothetical protein
MLIDREHKEKIVKPKSIIGDWALTWHANVNHHIV